MDLEVIQWDGELDDVATELDHTHALSTGHESRLSITGGRPAGLFDASAGAALEMVKVRVVKGQGLGCKASHGHTIVAEVHVGNHSRRTRPVESWTNPQVPLREMTLEAEGGRVGEGQRWRRGGQRERARLGIRGLEEGHREW